MPTIPDTITVFLAMALAATAAVKSTAGGTDTPILFAQWMQLSICPEADAMADAIGEHQDQHPAP